jgi:predicted transcriptional regulator
MEIIGRGALSKWEDKITNLEKKFSLEENKKTPYGTKISKHRLFNDLYDLEPTEKVIYIGLLLFRSRENYCWPSMRTLASGLNLHKNTIQKGIWRLKEKGFIKIDKGRGEKGKRYGYWLLK